MEALIIQGTENTLNVNFDHTKDRLVLSGESRPENVRKFFEPLLEWVDQYSNYLYWITEKSPDQQKSMVVQLDFEYFNSSSAKYILDLIQRIKRVTTEVPRVSLGIEWIYDEIDEDMQDAGEEFEAMSEVDFTFKAK